MDVSVSKATDGTSPSGRQQYINRMSFTIPPSLLQSPKSGLIPSKSKLPLIFFSLFIGVGIAVSSQSWSGFWRPHDYDKIKNNLRLTSSSSIPTIFEMPARDQFVGAWVLKSYHIDDASTGARHYPLGQDAIGLIVSLLSINAFAAVGSGGSSAAFAQNLRRVLESEGVRGHSLWRGFLTCPC
jgi:hypothetical protein